MSAAPTTLEETGFKPHAPMCKESDRKMFRSLFVEPLLNTLERDAIWVMDVDKGKLALEMQIKQPGTKDMSISVIRRPVGVDGKPAVDENGKEVTVNQVFLSAPFATKKGSLVNGLGNVGDKTFPPVLGKEQRKVLTSNHPFSDLVADNKEKPTVNTWMRQQFDVSEAVREAFAMALLQDDKAEFGPPLHKTKPNEKRKAVNEARALFKAGQKAEALAKVYSACGQVTKLGEETVWDRVAKQRVATGRQRSENERYQTFTTGFFFDPSQFKKKEKGDPKPESKDEPKVHPDPKIQAHLESVRAKDKNPAIEYRYPEIYHWVWRPKPKWVKLPGLVAELDLFNEPGWVVMVSYTHSMILSPDAEGAFPCYLRRIYLLGRTINPLPVFSSTAAELDLDKAPDDVRNAAAKYQEEDRALVHQQDLDKNVRKYQQADGDAQDEKARKQAKADQVLKDVNLTELADDSDDGYVQTN